MQTELPSEWRTTALGDVCEVAIGGTPSRREPTYWATGNALGWPWASIADLKCHEVVTTKEKITDLGARNSNVKLLPKGTVMMSFKLTIGRVARAGTDLYTNEAIAGFLPSAAVDSEFLFNVLPLAAEGGDVDQAVKGKTLNKAKLLELSIPLPPLPEQRKIAEILGSVDEAIRATEAVIEQTRRVKEGLLQELLTKGIGHTKFKQTEIGEIPEGWEAPLLDEVARRGSGHTPSKSHPEYWDGDIKWVSLADTWKLDKVYVDATEKTIGPLGLENSSAVLHPPGTVFVSRDASVGRSAIAKCELAVSQHFIAWVCGPRLDNHFLYYFLQAHKSQFEGIAIGSTIKTIGLGYFRKLRLPLPPLAEQDRIVAALLSHDEVLQTAEQQLAQTRALKAGLLQDLLTGKVRVKP